ncbi:zinc-finger domain-containing protein [Staphylococcus canis]|uniref:zinc-finger domain-containing protein n=1 Tax=Staphylococcus canis TaxID=2724942 RepID=UPI001E589FB6|nr:zinc-finger domain-containing protein [Staphylococcus canis]
MQCTIFSERVRHVLTDSKKEAINHIDRLMYEYCQHCLIKTHLRKHKNRTQAHHFCINECSIGKQIQQLGNELQ